VAVPLPEGRLLIQAIDDDHAARRRLGHLSVGTRSVYVHSARAAGESRYANVRLWACGVAPEPESTGTQ
jgi:hypothetical protein